MQSNTIELNSNYETSREDGRAIKGLMGFGIGFSMDKPRTQSFADYHTAHTKIVSVAF